MQKQTRSIALSMPTVTPAVWMTLLLFLLATAMMGCELAEDMEEDLNGEGEEPEEDEGNGENGDGGDNGENGEDGDSASLWDSGRALPRA
ncbi:MAG: hypothetical protein ACLFV4_04200 [Candidatus Hydrogenedentota bacterium]